MLAGWLPGRSTGPVVVVAGPVVVDATVVVVGVWLVVGARVVVGPVVGGLLVVVDTMLVVVARVVVGAAVGGAAVVVGLAVVDDAVAVGWVVSEGERAVRVVPPSTLAGGWAVVGRAVVAGLLMAPCPGPAGVEGGGAVVGSRSPVVVVVVVDAVVGAGVVGEVGSAPGAWRGGWGWGSRVAEATRAARTAVVSPKTNSSSLQGRRGLARCRGGGVGMVHRPGSAGSSGS
jgi:hypothetical protein